MPEILIVDDEERMRRLLSIILERRGYRVDQAGNGSEALVKISNACYDMVISDIKMPKMDGLEATKAIRALPREDAKLIPILAMTANAFQDDINQSLAAGMNEHLAKPIEPLLLYRALQKYLFPVK